MGLGLAQAPAKHSTAKGSPEERAPYMDGAALENPRCCAGFMQSVEWEPGRQPIQLHESTGRA